MALLLTLDRILCLSDVTHTTNGTTNILSYKFLNYNAFKHGRRSLQIAKWLPNVK